MVTSLDLHNTRHDEVARKVEEFLYPHLNRGTSEVTIVTGNSGDMKRVVNETLKDYGLESTLVWGNNGALNVKLK